jgi:hypothetical protein
LKTTPMNPLEIKLVNNKYLAIDPMGITYGQAWDGESVKSFIHRMIKQFSDTEIKVVIEDSPVVKAVKQLFTKGEA